MGFINSIGQVISNRDNFKKWEKETNDKDAQRKALAQKNPPTQAQLDKAAKEGKVIIDIIDIMDTHSEDVAENTETATIIPQAFAPLLGMGGSSAIIAKFFLPKVENKEKAIKDTFKDKLYDLQKLEKIKEDETWKQLIEWVEKNAKPKKGEKSFKFDDEYGISKSKILQKANEVLTQKQVKGFGGIKNFFAQMLGESIKVDEKLLNGLAKNPDKGIQSYAKATIDTIGKENLQKLAKLNKKTFILLAIPEILFGVLFVGGTLLATKLQVNSSRIARWQSREKLNDPKYFVQYTDEQIQQANERLDEKESKEKGFTKRLSNKDNKNSFALMWNVIKDNAKYKEWKKQDTDDSKKVDRQLSEAELQDAVKDQEVIQRVTKIINNKAEDYSENMETTAEVLIKGTPFLGAGVGWLLSTIAEKFKVFDKMGEKALDDFADILSNEKAWNSEKTYKETGKEIAENIKNLNKGDKKAGLVETFRTFGAMFEKTQIDNKINKGEGLSKIGKALAFSIPAGRKTILTIAGATITGIAGSIIGLKLQKSSARAGRFIAKRELEQNPQNFIGYSDEELKEVSDVKAQKPSAGQKLKEYLLFIPNVVKQYFEYEKFNKEQGARNKALKEELLNTEVSEEQLAEAKNIQRKLFNTFEKVDDKSQEYSESTEAAIELAKPVVQYGGMLMMAMPAIVTLGKIASGKLTIPSFTQKVTGFFAKHSGAMNGKVAQAYKNSVTKNINAIVSTESAECKDVARTISNKISSTSKNLLGKELNWEQEGKIAKLAETVLNTIQKGNSDGVDLKTVDSAIDFLQKEINSIDLAKFELDEINQEKYTEYKNVITNILGKVKNSKDALKDETTLKNLIDDEIKLNFFTGYLKANEELAGLNIGELLVKNSEDLKKMGLDEELVEYITELQKTNIDEFLAEGFGKIGASIVDFKNTLIKIITNQEAIKEKGFMPTLLDSLKSKNSSFAKLIETYVPENILQNKKALEIFNNFKTTDFKNKEQVEAFKEVVLGGLKAFIKGSSDEAFRETISKTPLIGRTFSNCTKDQAIAIIENSVKIIENMPTEKLGEILSVMQKEMKENPIGFIKIVAEGRIKTLFITPEAAGAVVGLGAAWGALSLLATFVVESYLAKLQKEAGRLGVMKALEELSDPLYYANTEQTELSIPSTNTPATTQTTTTNKYLDIENFINQVK